MPNTKAAKKHLRTSAKKQAYNRAIKDHIKNLVRKTRKGIEANDQKKASEWLNQSLKALDKAAQKGVLKDNTKDRKKSRLHQKYNQAFKS